MDPVVLFGRAIESNFERRPVLTCNLIRAGNAVEQLLLNVRPNPDLLPSQQYLAKISMRYPAGK